MLCLKTKPRLLALMASSFVSFQCFAAGVPSITAFSPTSGAIGTQVTISGANFSSTPGENVVWFGATSAPVLSATTTNLVVSVPAGATYAPITVTINGLEAMALGSFIPTFAGDGSAISTNTIGPGLNLPAGSGPLAIAVADMDGDGKPDLVVANVWDHTISIFRNTSSPGSISFAPRVDLPPMLVGEPEEGDPNYIAVADLDGDGKPDILVCDWAHNQILVYQNLAVPGPLTTNSFGAGVGFGAAGEPINVRAADLDGDGRPEIVVANHVVSMISILRNTSTPGVINTNSFAPHFDLSTAGGTWDVAIADFDGDGKLDLAAANNGASFLSLFRNVSVPGGFDTNSFEARVDLPAPATGSAILAADLDGDGKPDLIDSASSLAIYRNLASPGTLSTNSFATMIVFSNIGPSAMAIGDLNGDGKPDICLGGNLSVLQNNSIPGSLTTNSLGPLVSFSTSTAGIIVCDLDGDGRPDIAACNLNGNVVSIFQNLAPFGGPPVIVAQPANLAVPVNTTATFSSFVAGKAPLNYEWFVNGTNVSDGGRIAGSTTANLSISNIQLTDTDTCYLIITNSLGAATSVVATLTPVVLPPNFTQQPQSQTNILGSNTVFSAAVTGSQPMSLQWLLNNTALSDGGRISGSATTSLTITNLQTNDAGAYILVASNAANVTTSMVASLVILVPPIFTPEPSNQSVELGSNAVFSVIMAGTPPFGYQWYFNGTQLTNNAVMSGVTSPFLTISNVQPQNVGSYSVVVTNSAGTATSSVAALTISTPLISAQPQSQSVFGGATVTFGVAATGQQPLIYQWQFDGTNSPGATNNPLVLTNVLVSQAGTYSVTVTNQYGTAISSNATLTVTGLTITAQPAARITWLNGPAAFTVQVSGNGPFNYQWQSNGTPIAGANTNTLTLTNVTSSQFGTYNVIVSNPYGSVTSSNASLLFSQVADWGGYQGESNLTTNLTNIIAISGGENGAPFDCLALSSNGVLIAWPTSAASEGPHLSNLVAIAGANPAFGLLSDGNVVRSPSDGSGIISGLSNIVAISANGASYVVLTASGIASNGPPLAGPSPAASNVLAIAAGGGHSLALTTNGTVAAWGYDGYGETNVPQGLSNVIAVAAGDYHSLALKANGTVVGWGLNGNGQISVPPSLSNVVEIAAGGYHSLALKADGSVVAWGLNDYGQTNVPAGLTNVIAIGAGLYHSMALIGSGPPVAQVLLTNPAVNTNGFSLDLPTQSGRVYVLEYKNSLSGSIWTPLPLQAGNGGTLLLTDPAATNSQRFYRVQKW